MHAQEIFFKIKANIDRMFQQAPKNRSSQEANMKPYDNQTYKGFPFKVTHI